VPEITDPVVVVHCLLKVCLIIENIGTAHQQRIVFGIVVHHVPVPLDSFLHLVVVGLQCLIAQRKSIVGSSFVPSLDDFFSVMFFEVPLIVPQRVFNLSQAINVPGFLTSMLLNVFLVNSSSLGILLFPEQSSRLSKFTLHQDVLRGKWLRL
jgi:hypothetical protein